MREREKERKRCGLFKELMKNHALSHGCARHARYLGVKIKVYRKVAVTWNSNAELDLLIA